MDTYVPMNFEATKESVKSFGARVSNYNCKEAKLMIRAHTRLSSEETCRMSQRMNLKRCLYANREKVSLFSLSFHMAQQIIPAAQLVPKFQGIGRCNKFSKVLDIEDMIKFTMDAQEIIYTVDMFRDTLNMPVETPKNPFVLGLKDFKMILRVTTAQVYNENYAKLVVSTMVVYSLLLLVTTVSII
ncbi:hypothetical protein Tco_0168785 [Tanacetum coccineum]